MNGYSMSMHEGNNDSKVKVLSFGYIQDLLQKRHQILADAGFQVTSVDVKAKVIELIENGEFNAIVIGHGVPVEQRNEIASRAKIRKKMGVIFLYRWNINKAECADAVLSIDSSAEYLAEAIRRIASRISESEEARRQSS